VPGLLLAIVPLDDILVTADFRETQVRKMTGPGWKWPPQQTLRAALVSAEKDLCTAQ